MKFLVLSFFILLASCAPKRSVVEKPKVVKPVYHLPVKGAVYKSGRGVFIKTRCSGFVRAVQSGKVAYSGRDLGNYGWVVIVEQEDGFVSVYGKLGKPWVKSGERVRNRQVIGRVGRVKDACGVYYELRNSTGEPVQPVLR
ncbi:murein hydrolase activator EnvC family protein [Hydrogenivirga sp.]